MIEDEIDTDVDADAELEASSDETSEENPEVMAVGADGSSEIVEGTELEEFESASIEDVEVLTEEQVMSIVESALFATDKPASVAVIKQAFKGTNVRSKEIRAALMSLQNEYFQTQRGFTLEEVAGGFQLRTKPENMKYLRQSVKARSFKLSGPALEVISICAYKQPVTKAQIDEIRGVESGHLLRALMERGMITFGERSDLPGKPMFYETTRKFLEIFGLRNIQELPSLNEIDQLIPEGIGDEEKKETLSDLTGELSQSSTGISYSEGEDELLKITDELSGITTSSEFFEEEKRRQRERRDLERAQDIREAIAVGEPVEDKDRRWLERYETNLLAAEKGAEEVDFVTAPDETIAPESGEMVAAVSEHEVTESDVTESPGDYRDEMKDMDTI
jgi:segregation and condensation protein B